MSSEMRKLCNLVEMYSSDNSALLRYLRSAEFDPYAHWHEIADWAEDHEEAMEEFSEILGQPVDTAEELFEEEPELFYKLSPHLQDEAKEHVYDYLQRHNPSELPTHAHAGLSSDKLLKRTTWLIHFSDHAPQIALNGFIYGIDQMDRLGLTTWLSDREKSYGGYNFAFVADSRYAWWAASEKKYGRHAVMFQSSGVKTIHYGDEEEQVIFYGSDVKPSQIVLLYNDHGDWCIRPQRPVRGDRDCLFRGEFQPAVKWVMEHAWRYRRALGLQ